MVRVDIDVKLTFQCDVKEEKYDDRPELFEKAVAQLKEKLKGSEYDIVEVSLYDIEYY